MIVSNVIVYVLYVLIFLLLIYLQVLDDELVAFRYALFEDFSVFFGSHV